MDSLSELTYKNYVQIGDGEPVLLDQLQEKERRHIGILLNDQALRALGYEPDKEQLEKALNEVQ